MTYRVYLTTKVNLAKLAKGSGIIVIEPDDYTIAQIKAIKAKVGGFLLEYTRDEILKTKIGDWCKKYGASCCISGDVNL